MVVLNVSEDIEAKIRRLRELGKASAEPEPPIAPKPAPAKKPPRRPRSIGSIRAKERKKRVILGAAIILIIILAVSAGAYMYLQNRTASEISKARAKKLAEVNTYFKSSVFNNTNCTKDVIVIRTKLVNQIVNAKTLGELNAIDVRDYYDFALKKYNACIEHIQQVESEKQLNITKAQKITEIEASFQPFLSMPLPDAIKNKAVTYMNSLEDRVNSATTPGEVNAVNPDPYLLELWRDYKFWRIDQLAEQGHGSVILEYNGVRELVSAADAKAILGGILDYKELMKYRVLKVQWVELSLVLPRKNIDGAFLSPGDKIEIYIQGRNTTSIDGYFELVLLPVQEGTISVSESQSQSGSSSTSSSTTYGETQSSSVSPGGNTMSDSSSSQNTYSNSQSSSQSSSASYSYNVNLAEILKAIAAGKIQSSDQVKAELNAYGWKVLDLEKSTALETFDSNTPMLVIIKVPSIFVPDILQNQNYVYIAKVST
ncbi:DUF515 domain-containing protein [Thermococcus sp.]|uniref:DUF515 domain-containing protein n=1 Tax=Thermococcus sp. TaxID=35749 RepID=UPI00261A480A|nr:DUF515 domain-containing protein [Thermococcus sp.]